ncbi:hypothetical protein A5839_001886, partial [Enterococcus faecium]
RKPCTKLFFLKNSLKTHEKIIIL